MKILLLGEYSNVHWTLAEGLRHLGHEVTVVSNGDFWKNYPRDISVVRREGKLGGIIYLLRLLTILKKLKGYDVVQLVNPMFFELKAERVEWFYGFLRRNNKKIVMGSFGMDYYWVNVNSDKKPLRYSDFNIGNETRTDIEAKLYQEDWAEKTAKAKLNRKIARECDNIVAGLYEYDVTYRTAGFSEKTVFIPFPIVVDKKKNVSNRLSNKNERLKIFVGISKNRSAYKGTDIMLKAAQRVAKEHSGRVELTVAEGVPFNQYKKMLDEADVLLDQLYSYTPAMNALEAMARGTIVVGGGEPENYEILCEKDFKPIINVLPNEQDVYEKLKNLVLLDKQEILELKRQSMEYVEKHHDYIKVAKQYEALYER